MQKIFIDTRSIIHHIKKKPIDRKETKKNVGIRCILYIKKKLNRILG